jgi:hypothetical protein
MLSPKKPTPIGWPAASLFTAGASAGALTGATGGRGAIGQMSAGAIATSSGRSGAGPVPCAP